MFIQHQVKEATASEKIVKHSEDFDLIIQSKTKDALQGKITFNYLQQSFEAAIKITSNSIQIKAQQPFAGIQAIAPTLDKIAIEEKAYLLNGSVTKSGHQNIVWLILDFIHLYNLLRLKPGSILELYRAAFSFAKENDSELVFGNISLQSPIANATAKFLGQNLKRKHKYVYGNDLALLASFQEILANYPQQFLTAQFKVNKLDTVLS